MNKLLDDYLCKKYPKIFADRKKPMNQTAMCWGFDCEDGWFLLIDGLCAAIQSHVDNAPWKPEKSLRNWFGNLWNKTVGNWVLYPAANKFLKYDNYQKVSSLCSYTTRYVPAPIPQVVARQVKEKFGSLRFYVSGSDDTVDGIIRLAEVMSVRICEKCGALNELVTLAGQGWIQTTCSACTQNKNRKNHEENLDPELINIFKQIRQEKVLTRREKTAQVLKQIEEIKNYK